MKIIKGKIKKGATVFSDHNIWTWPDMPHGDISKIFTMENSAVEGRVFCRADNFGVHPPEGKYGNGSLFVKLSDIVESD